MGERLTVKQVLEITADILGGVSVPVGLIDQIGVPIRNALGNIQECINAMNAAENPPKPAPVPELEEEEDDVEVEVKEIG